MLLQGTKGQSEADIASFFENLGCVVTPLAAESSFGLSLSFLKSQEKRVYEKIVEVILESTFPENKLELLKEKTLEELRLDLEDLWEIHSREFKEVFV